MGIESPFYPEINNLVAQMESAVTLSMRSNGPVNCNLNNLVTNLVCYPRIFMTYPSYTPFNHNERRSFNETIVSDLTKQIFMA